MAYPPRPSRRTSYTQSANAGLAFSNANLDAEHNDFVEQIDQLNTFVRGITTASGTLKNLSAATAQALAGSQRFVATDGQTVFTTTITYVAAFNSLNVEVFSQGVRIDSSLITVANSGGFLQVTIPAQTLSNIVFVAAFESGAGVLTRLANTASGADGANMIGVQDTGALIAATTVEGALTEIVTNLNAYIALVGNVAELFKRNGSVAATGDFNLGSHKITGLLDGVATTDAATVGQVNSASATLASLANSFIKRDGSNSPSADVSWNSKKITSLATPTASGDAATKGYVDGLATSSTPTGAVISFAGGSVPTGWLLCDGTAVSRTTYAALFTAIGTAFGAGDGTTTFNLPPSSGRCAIGAGTGSGLSPRSLAQTGGEETHVLTLAESAAHAHKLVDDGTGRAIATLGGGGFGQASFSSDSSGSTTPQPNTNSQGGGGAHNNMQPYIVFNVIIKT